MTEPKLDETWRRRRRKSSNELYYFEFTAFDYEQNEWFVWYSMDTGRAFVISEDDFLDDRNNWEKV